TRARHALWLASGMLCNYDKSPLRHMVAKPEALVAALGAEVVAVDGDEPPASLPWLPPASTDPVPPARIAARSLASDWWVYSFTQLANAEGQEDTAASATQPAAGGQDEPAGEDDAGMDVAMSGAGVGAAEGAREGVQAGEGTRDGIAAGVGMRDD